MKMLTSAKAMFIALAALALAGCSSYSEIARWNSAVKVNDGETPMATFLTQNFSYQLLWCIPICTGVPWSKEQGGGDCMDEYRVRLFTNLATVDGNLESLNYALDRVGSRRIAHVITSQDDSSAWSLFLLNRHEVRTSCLILPPNPPAAKAKQ
ncbi:MAG: hypothetical protein IJG70_08545 [Kiritimatiellae bacterium]|nr:hypothetical protein [Kiritimatiellia bacterium]